MYFFVFIITYSLCLSLILTLRRLCNRLAVLRAKLFSLLLLARGLSLALFTVVTSLAKLTTSGNSMSSLTASNSLPGLHRVCFFMFFYNSHNMQVLASLRKRTKTGVSTWTFCVDNEMGVQYAVGGESPVRVIEADDRKHLRAIFQNFVSYGYTRKLPALVEATPTPSVLPEDLRSDLWALEPTYA